MPLRIGQEVQALLRRHLSPVNAAFRRRLLRKPLARRTCEQGLFDRRLVCRSSKPS